MFILYARITLKEIIILVWFMIFVEWVEVNMDFRIPLVIINEDHVYTFLKS
jgi:hypothetical protein